jgi:hypothetical protein
MSQTRKTQSPKFSALPNGDVIISMREYIADLVSQTGTPSSFGGQFFAINPGVAATFPWLYRIAANYESYQFIKLAFCYETEAPSTTGGTVILAVDYDALDAPPQTKQQAMTYRGSVRSSPWNGCRHVSQSEDFKKYRMYTIRPTGTPLPTNYDLKTYDVGNFFALTQGCPASTILGEVYVDYTVKLITPGTTQGFNAFVQGGRVVGGGGLTGANPFGPTPAFDPQDFGISMSATSVLTITYPGYFCITVNVVGTGITALTLTGSNLVAITQLEGVTNGTNTTTQLVYRAQTFNSLSTITFAATATTVTAVDMQIGTAPLFSLT